MSTNTEGRIKFIRHKYNAIVRLLSEAIEAHKGKTIDQVDFSLRLDRVKELLHNYEDLHEELIELDGTHELINNLQPVQDTYYKYAASIKPPESQANITNIGNLTAIDRPKLLKLPVPTLPKFNGTIAKWMSYKNVFTSMVDARTDIDDLAKFMFLRDSLEGEAANKIIIYDASAENYQRAWQALVDSYEKKRLLVSTHIDALLDIAPVIKATPIALTGLIDTAKQHLNTLDSLQEKPTERMIVRILERALPNNTRNEWEKTLTMDVLPSLEQFFKFIKEVAYRLNTMEHNNSRNQDKGVKRSMSSHTNGKYLRTNSGARTLYTNNVSSSCILCGGAHHLYACPDFGKKTIQQRWELVKEKKLCRNCLRVHPNPCASARRCRTCNKPHHTSLHNEKIGNKASTSGVQENAKQEASNL